MTRSVFLRIGMWYAETPAEPLNIEDLRAPHSSALPSNKNTCYMRMLMYADNQTVTPRSRL